MRIPVSKAWYMNVFLWISEGTVVIFLLWGITVGSFCENESYTSFVLTTSLVGAFAVILKVRSLCWLFSRCTFSLLGLLKWAILLLSGSKCGSGWLFRYFCVCCVLKMIVSHKQWVSLVGYKCVCVYIYKLIFRHYW